IRGGKRRFRLLPKTILLPMELLLLFLQALLPIRRRRRPLLPPVILLLPLSQRALSRRCRTCWIPRRPMDHHSGHALPLLTAFLAPRSLCSRTERCVAQAFHPLFVQERRPERNGSLRVLYAARLADCRP